MTAPPTSAAPVTASAGPRAGPLVQSVQGRSALVAGLAMAPQGLITGLSTVLAPRWLAGLTVRVTVLAGFAVLAVASLGLLLIVTATPLWLIAAILAGRSVAIGLVAALYATRARSLGPVAALHSAGLILVAAVGALGALVLPAVRNTAMEHS